MVILHIKRQTENNILNETEKKTAREQVPGPLNSDELSFDLRLTFTLLQRCEIWIKSELVYQFYGPWSDIAKRRVYDPIVSAQRWLFNIFRFSWEFNTYMETSIEAGKAANFDLYSAPLAIEKCACNTYSDMAATWLSWL